MNWKTLLSIFCLLPILAVAQAPQPAQKPDVLLPDFETGRAMAARYSEQEILRHLKVLASDSLEGRETGLRGQKMASDYIEMQFRHLGLRPLFVNGTDSSFRQVFPIFRNRVTNAGIAYKGKAYLPGRDLVPLPPLADSLTEKGLRLVLASPNEMPKDLAGAIVMLLDTSRLAGKPVRRKVAVSEPYFQAGARAVLLATPFSGYNRDIATHGWRRFRNGTMSLEKPQNKAKSTKGMALVSMQTAAEILGTDSASLMALAASKGASDPKLLARLMKPKRTLDIDFKSGRDELGTENMGAYIRGRTKPDEVVVLTAHYDHLGVMDGQVYNGADDDGSGTSNVLEMARLYSDAAKQGIRPYRSVAFVLFTGEEKGLLGSEYYSRYPAFPMEKTSANLNTDMIGRVDEKHATGPAYTYMIGSDKISRALDELVKETNRQCCSLELDYAYNDENHPDQFYYRSDHYNFAKKGVPVAFWFTGVHPDYHEHTDDIEKILLPRVSAVGKHIFLTGWGIAQRPTLLERVK